MSGVGSLGLNRNAMESLNYFSKDKLLHLTTPSGQPSRSCHECSITLCATFAERIGLAGWMAGSHSSELSA